MAASDYHTSGVYHFQEGRSRTGVRVDFRFSTWSTVFALVKRTRYIRRALGCIIRQENAAAAAAALQLKVGRPLRFRSNQNTTLPQHRTLTHRHRQYASSQAAQEGREKVQAEAVAENGPVSLR